MSACIFLPLFHNSYSYPGCCIRLGWVGLGNWCIQQTSHLLFYPIHPAYTDTTTHSDTRTLTLTLTYTGRQDKIQIQIQRLCMHPHLHPPGLIHWRIDPLNKPNQASAHNQPSYKRGIIHSFRECLSVFLIYLFSVLSSFILFFSSHSSSNFLVATVVAIVAVVVVTAS